MRRLDSADTDIPVEAFVRSPPSAGPTMLSRLRAATADPHRRLEEGLDLLAAPLSKARFTAVLGRFLGFHAVWEPALRRHAGLATLLEGRSRLAQLHADLAALGLTEAETAVLPRCAAAARLARTPASALGSIYVLEGSTLGGQVISRALAEAPWLPAGGLTAFNPYGRETGLMWAGFRRWLETADAADCEPAAQAAVETFELLSGWLTEGARA